MIKCPMCKHVIDVLENRQEEAYLEVVRIAGMIGAHSNLFLEYALLRGGGRLIKGRELKLQRIMQDLSKLWNCEEFSYDGRVYRISRTGILVGLKAVCDRHFTQPLPNDNYLKKILIAEATKEANKKSAEKEKDLIRREKNQRGSGLRPGQVCHEDEPLAPETAHKLFGEFLRGGTPNEK